MGKRKKLLIILTPAVLILTGVLVVVAGKPPFLSALAGNPANAGEDVQGRRSYSVSREDIIVSVPGAGVFEPAQVTTVRPDPEMPTRKVKEILVKPGDHVRAGQLVVRMDSSQLDLEVRIARDSWEAQKIKLEDLKARPTREELLSVRSDLTQAEYELELRQGDWENVRKLSEKGFASREQLLDAEKQFKLAEAQLEKVRLTCETVSAGATEEELRSQTAAASQAHNSFLKAEAALESVSIRTPVDGVVTEVAVQEGDILSASGAVMTVADMTTMILIADVDENDISRVRVGQKTKVNPVGLGERHFSGTVTGKSLMAKTVQNLTMFEVFIEVPNGDLSILWGMNSDAEITIQEERGVLVLPVGAVRKTPRGSMVMIREGSEVVPRQVQTGVSDGVNVQILNGLSEGDQVVSAQAVVPGQQNGGRQSAPSGNMMFRAFR